MRVRNWFYRLMAEQIDDQAAGGGGGGGAAAPVAAAGAATAGATGAAASGSTGEAAGAAASGEGATAGKAIEGDWAPDWREKIAGTDEKLLGRLSRYASPKAVTEALVSVQNRISAGELRGALPKNATEEQTKLWRSENGIPESPDKYELKLADGLVIGTEDKPLIDNLLKSVHEANGNGAVASKVVEFYFAQVERAEQQRHDADRVAAQTAQDALNAEWGTEFRPNMNAIEGLLGTMPQDVKDLFKFGRLSDQTPIMGNADVIRWLNGLSRQINPVSTLIPNAGANMAGAIDDEIKKYETNMAAPKGTPASKAYWDDPKAQERYRELLTARERGKQKAA